MGAVLEPIALRSTLPTGRVTLRYSIPTIHVALPEVVVLDGTTPQVPTVVLTTGQGETAARKGGQAR